MKTEKILISLILLAALPAMLTAASLELGAAQQLAVEASSTVRSAQLDVQTAKRTSEIDTNLPTLSLSGGLSASGSLLDKTTYAFSPSLSVGASLSAGVRFSFFDGDQYTTQSRLLSVDSAELSLESQQLSVQKQATTLYWNLAAQKLNVQSLESALQLTSSTYQSNLEKYDNGLIDQLTLKQSELSLYNAEQNLSEAERSEKNAESDLAAYLGVAEVGDLDPLMEIRELKDISSFSEQINKSLTARQAELSLARSQLSYESALYSATTPTLSVSASMGLNGSYTAATNQFGVSESYSGSLSVSLPTDSWFKNSSVSANLDNLQTAIEQAGISRDQSTASFLDTIQSAYDAVDKCIRQQTTLTRQQELLEEQLRLTTMAYNAGSESFSNLQSAQNSVFQGKINILQNQLDYTMEICSLALTLGVEASELTK